MTNGDGTPSMSELARRIERIEGRLDARTLSVDVYQAEKLALQIQMGAVERRLQELEEARQASFRLLVGAFLGFVVNTIGLLIGYVTLSGGPR